MPITGPLHLHAVMDEYAARYMGPEILAACRKQRRRNTTVLQKLIKIQA
jgi:hypothetical protein